MLFAIEEIPLLSVVTAYIEFTKLNVG